jgi:acyl-CoA synthetase (AMP-forming)/AMP-acid ligase II
MAALEDGLGIKVIILSDSLKEKISFSDASRPADSYRDKVGHPHDPVALIYTSGTTGLPKAFGFQLGRHYPYAKVSRIWLGQTYGDIWYCPMPLYHGTGALVSVNCLMNGTTIAVGRKFSISRFWDDVRDSKATMFIYVGETPRYLLSAPPSPNDKNHNLRLMYGNGMRPDVWERFQKRFGRAKFDF